MRVERLICTNCLEQCSKQVTEGLVVLIIIMRETRRVNNVTFNDSSRNRGPHWRDKCKVGHLLENKCKVLGYLLKYFFFQTVGIFFFFLKQGGLRVATTVGRFQSLGVKDMGSYAAPS